MSFWPIIAGIIISAAMFVGFYQGFSSGKESQEEQDEEIKEAIEDSELINSDLYFNLRMILAIPVGWVVLSFVFSLNGLTLIQPYMVNSTLLWNWGVFLFTTWFVGIITWILVEKIYLRIQ
jgi:Na+/H+ antiporter NhaC